jgi:hypothetical protein
MKMIKATLILTAIAILSGCIAVPVAPGPGYYGPPAPAYYGPSVGFGFYGGGHGRYR